MSRDAGAVYTADFETCDNRAATDGHPTEVRVWLWAACSIETKHVDYGRDIMSFLGYMRDNPGDYWFHNLAFDGTHIIDALFRIGYTVCFDRRPKPRTFTALISDKGKFYHLGICFPDGTKCDVYDSLKKFPMSVATLAKTFGTPETKGSIDYTAWRGPGYEPTPEELGYIHNDVMITARAMEADYNDGLTRMTIGSDCFHWYKANVGDAWGKLFPKLNTIQDAQMREAYRGGYCRVDPDYKGVDVHGGISVDYNSMYPSMMLLKPFPYGYPVYYQGRYEQDESMPLYIQTLTCTFHVKPRGFPMVQLKNSPWYGEHEYVEETVDAVTLTLSSVDLELFFENYDVDVWSWDYGYKFHAMRGMFTDYIKYWAEVKQRSTGGARLLAKLFLNNLYGKFGTNPNVTGKYPALEGDVVELLTGEHDERPPVYVPVAIFATAWARHTLLTAAAANRDRFLYCDTDSLHLLGTEPPAGIECDPVRLGAWKVEGEFSRARHLRTKCYIWDLNGKLSVTCAGMPDNIKAAMTWDNFQIGYRNYDVIDGRPVIKQGQAKLQPLMVKGGRTLIDRIYSLR